VPRSKATSATAAILLGCAAPTLAAESGGGHADPFAGVLLSLAAVIVIAMVGRWVAQALDQPSVLGELLAGVVVGNFGFWLGAPLFVLIMHLGNAQPIFALVWNSGLDVAAAAARVYSPAELEPGGVGAAVVAILTGPHASEHIIAAAGLWLFSNLGVILLLFMVGLESTVAEMLAVGPRALAVALVGVIAPFTLGYAASAWLVPETPSSVHLFVGATLCATSVGITARVFKDLDRLQTAEAKIILGAAVIDDVLGLVILAVVSGIVASGGVSIGEIARISLLSALFLGVVILFGERLVKAMVPVMEALDRRHLRLLFPLALAFGLSWLANQIELAAIVGAFAAGLILNEKQFPKLSGEHAIEIAQMIHPLEAIFAPVFFVLMGMQVNLATFGAGDTIVVALALTLVALFSKSISGLPAGAGVDKMTIGMGMIPRGEVGLIFASVGKALGVVDEGLFSAIVIVVILTTLAAPLLLKWSMSRAPS